MCLNETQKTEKYIISNIANMKNLDKIVVINCVEKKYKEIKLPKVVQLKYWDNFNKYGHSLKYKVALEPIINTEAIIFVDDIFTIDESTCSDLFTSWQNNNSLVHGPNSIALNYNNKKNKYEINRSDCDPHIILSDLCIVSKKYIDIAQTYILEIDDIFKDFDPYYTGIDICLSIVTACKYNSYKRSNILLQNLKYSEINKPNRIDWSKNVYSDICTLSIHKFFNNKDTSYEKTTNYSEVLVVLPFFNFACFNQLYANIHDAVHNFNNQNINILVMEAVFTGNISQLYTLPCKVLTTETDTIAFHKEGLFNKAFHLYENDYEVFVLCDSDIIFKDNLWVKKMIALFKTGVEAAQPFSVCHWTDKNGEICSSSRSYSFIRSENERIGIWNSQKITNLRQTYHPGFVWAFSKNFLLRTNGLFSKCFTGAGDLMVLYLVEGIAIGTNNIYNYMQPELNDFLTKGKAKQGVLNGEIYHLYHGNSLNRQYYERHQTILKERINLGPEFFSKELDNFLIKATHPKVNEINLEYFKARREDD